MDVFELRDQVISEYRSYSSSFVEVADERIQEQMEAALDRGLLWPDPLIGLNPAFEPGATVDELADAGRLHPLAKEIFRKDKSPEDPEGRTNDPAPPSGRGPSRPPRTTEAMS